MNGFRKMISDNIPKTWDIALRWCKCRQYWIDTAYNIYVGRFNNDYRKPNEIKRLKAEAVKQLTHQQKINGKHMKFEDTVNLGNLLIEDDGLYEYWKVISGWIKFFEKNYAYIKSSATIQMECKGSSVDEVAYYINRKYNLNNVKLAYYIIKTIK